MKSKTSQSVYRAALAPMVALTSAVFLMLTLTVRAEMPEATQDSRSQARTLEGTWRVQITLRNCQTGDPLRPPFPALATFAQGGTLTTADGGLSPLVRGPGHGIWRHAGGHTFGAVSEAFLFTATGSLNGTQRITQSIEIGRDADEFYANVSSGIFDINGILLAPGCATSVGRRME